MATKDAAVYEVMIDTWGDKYQRGDLVTEGDCDYDLESALARGVVRVADVFNGQPVSSLGRPVNADGSVDWSLQDATRYGAGLPDPHAQRVILEAELNSLDTRKEFLQTEIDRLAAEEDKMAARRQQVDEMHTRFESSPRNQPATPATQVGSAPQPGISRPAVPGMPGATHPDVQREAEENRERQAKARDKGDK